MLSAFEIECNSNPHDQRHTPPFVICAVLFFCKQKSREIFMNHSSHTLTAWLHTLHKGHTINHPCYTNTYLLHFTLVQTHSCDDKSYHVSSTVNFPLFTIQEGKNNTNKRDLYLRTMNNHQRWEGEPHGTLCGCLCVYSIVMDNA